MVSLSPPPPFALPPSPPLSPPVPRGFQRKGQALWRARGRRGSGRWQLSSAFVLQLFFVIVDLRINCHGFCRYRLLLGFLSFCNLYLLRGQEGWCHRPACKPLTDRVSGTGCILFSSSSLTSQKTGRTFLRGVPPWIPQAFP